LLVILTLLFLLDQTPKTVSIIIKNPTKTNKCLIGVSKLRAAKKRYLRFAERIIDFISCSAFCLNTVLTFRAGFFYPLL
jgi:hypothetical protein